MASYNLSLQPGGGFTIRNDMNPMQSYTVNRGFLGDYTMQNQLSPSETYTLRSQPFDGNWNLRVHGAENSRPWWNSDYAVPNSFGSQERQDPFGAYGVHNGAASPTPFSQSPWADSAIRDHMPAMPTIPGRP